LAVNSTLKRRRHTTK